MARGIRAIILNTNEDIAVELRSQFLAIDGLKIVAELDEPALFDNAIKQFPAELVIINLDSNPEELMQAAAQIIGTYPDLTLFAVSDSANPQMILQAMRNGFREYLVRPIDVKQLSEAVGRINKLSTSQPASGKLICVFGAVGGIGTTTLATNLGCELAQFEKTSAVVVDLDMHFGHVSTMLDLTPQFTIADLCQTLDSIDPSMIEKALLKHACGVQVLARPLHFNQAEQISAANIATVINTLCGMFDYVICDGPDRTSAVRPGVLDLADTTLITLNLTVPAVRNIDRINHALAESGYNLDRTKLILSRFTHENNTLSIEDVETSLNRKINYTIPEEAKVLSAAINTGQPLMEFAPKSKVREAIRSLAEAIHHPDELSEENSKPSGVNGLFARMLGR
jgi:pilus assembly protein CpaE